MPIPQITVTNNPIPEDSLANLRDKNENTIEFRTDMKRVSMILAIEATKQLKTTQDFVTTDTGNKTTVNRLNRDTMIVPILRSDGTSTRNANYSS